MKRVIHLILITCALLGCSQRESPHQLAGKWDQSSMIRYYSDTIGGIDEFTPPYITIHTIKTDSGTFDHRYIRDSLIIITRNTTLNVMHFEFDNETHGVSSFYEQEPNEVFNEDPRFSGTTYSFWLFDEENKDYLIFDYGFDQFGRVLDTVEYQILAKDRLIINGDTLKRID